MTFNMTFQKLPTKHSKNIFPQFSSSVVIVNFLVIDKADNKSDNTDFQCIKNSQVILIIF